MCVIATKQSGFALPDKETLERCFTANSDGAGFAWNEAGKVHWFKGLMTFEAFYTKLKEVFPTPEKELASSIIMHFRIGTHGPKNTESHTHPFPIVVDSMTEMCALSGENDAVMFHNGIMHGMPNLTKEKVLDSVGKSVDPSDSQIFAYLMLRPLWSAKQAGALDEPSFDRLMTQLCDSQRVAVLDSTGAIFWYGFWQTPKADYPGCSFSNCSFEKPKVSTLPPANKYFPGHTYLDDYDDDTHYSHQDFWSKPYTPNKVVETSIPTTFWESYYKVPLTKKAQKRLELQKLPEGTLIAIPRTTKKFVTYCSTLDGDVLYRFSTKRKDSPATLYLIRGENVHMIGLYNITIPTTERSVSNESVKQFLKKCSIR